MNRVYADGYWRLVGRFGKKTYFGRVIFIRQERKLHKPFTTASEAVAYSNRVAARYMRLMWALETQPWET